MTLTIIGLGLIGGSAAIDLKKRGFAKHIIGVDNDTINATTAQHIGFVDEIATLDEAISRSQLIIVAIPVDAAVSLLPVILDKTDAQIVTDMCSTKTGLIEAVKHHPKRANYVASHPMAGTEFSGPWAAVSGLFDGKATILCDAEHSSEQAVTTITNLYECLNMRILRMNGKSHDTHVAYVSHISHISSFALALTVLEKERNEKNIFDLASGGFDSTVRLAKSSADMWAPIFNQNKANILTVLNTYIDKLNQFKALIEQGENQELKSLMNEANRIKRVLK